MIGWINNSKFILVQDKHFAHCLFAAYLISQDQVEQAKNILKNVNENANLENDMNLKKLVYRLLGPILKDSRHDHTEVTRGLQMMESLEEFREKDEYIEWSHYLIPNPDKYVS